VLKFLRRGRRRVGPFIMSPVGIGRALLVMPGQDYKTRGLCGHSRSRRYACLKPERNTVYARVELQSHRRVSRNENSISALSP